jgi:hypothetical protein
MIYCLAVRKVGTKWVDINTTATGEACINCELCRVALLHDVGENLLDTMLMKFIMLTK